MVGWRDSDQTSMLEVIVGRCLPSIGGLVMARHGRRGRRRGTVLHRQRSKALEQRVRRVGPEHFGILAVDSAKKRFAVLLTDFYGRTLMDVVEVDNTGPALEGLVTTVKAQCAARGEREAEGRATRCQTGWPACSAGRAGRSRRAGVACRAGVHPGCGRGIRRCPDPVTQNSSQPTRECLRGRARWLDALPHLGCRASEEHLRHPG